MQLPEPELDAYLPWAHWLHDVAAAAAYFPATHGVPQAVAPVKLE